MKTKTIVVAEFGPHNESSLFEVREECTREEAWRDVSGKPWSARQWLAGDDTGKDDIGRGQPSDIFRVGDQFSA